MRAIEFVTEDKHFRNSAKSAIPGMQTHTLPTNDPYMLYRFGVALAGSPDRQSDTHGPSQGMKMITVSYTKGEQEIIDATSAHFDASVGSVTTKDSYEIDTINTVSPMTPKGPIKRKS